MGGFREAADVTLRMLEKSRDDFREWEDARMWVPVGSATSGEVAAPALKGGSGSALGGGSRSACGP
jgi:hypothetical protein